MIREIGNYQIIDEDPIAGPRKGRVYRARDKREDTLVAIKLFSPVSFQSAREFESFKARVAEAAMLKHANIVTVHSLLGKFSQGYLVMELIEGDNLQPFMDANHTLKEKVELCLQILAGLNYLHRHNITHGGIKPRNILMGKDGVPKVTDYLKPRPGAGSWLKKNPKASELTPYSTPEQIRGRGIDARTDIYSVGAIMYELFTHRPPFMGSNLSDIIQRHLKTYPEVPSFVNEEIPATLDHIIMRALRKKPKDRHQTVAEMILTLEKLVERKM